MASQNSFGSAGELRVTGMPCIVDLEARRDALAGLTLRFKEVS